MSLASFPHPALPHRPRTGGGKLLSAVPGTPLAFDPQLPPRIKLLRENDIRGFPQIHSPSLQYKRYLFPLRNE
jgi:hypothetical protein